MDRASRPTGLAKIGIALALAGLLAQANAQPIPGALPESAKALSQGEWPAYAGTYAAARYSPLTQIDRSNAKSLHIAWRWKSPDMAVKEVTGDAALLVDPLDVAAISHSLAELLESPERRADFAERGLERATHYSWSQVAERTVEVYHRALGH